MVVGFTTTYAISAYHHLCCAFDSRTGARCATLCDKVFQWLAACRLFSPGTPVSSTNKTDCHDIAEILMKVALNTIKPTNHKLPMLHVKKESCFVYRKTTKSSCSVSLISGWTTYVLHPGIFFIENFIMAEIFQPSDKIKLIFILF